MISLVLLNFWLSHMPSAFPSASFPQYYILSVKFFLLQFLTDRRWPHEEKRTVDGTAQSLSSLSGGSGHRRGFGRYLRRVADKVARLPAGRYGRRSGSKEFAHPDLCQKLDEKSNRYWRGLNREPGDTGAIFSDLPVSGTVATDSADFGNMGAALRRLLTLALAWAAKGCQLYQNTDALRGVMAAADRMTANYFKIGRYSRSAREKKPFENGYHWEVTCPTALVGLITVLYDELTERRIRTYTETIRYYVNTCTKPMLANTNMTGGNLLLKANGLAQAESC